MRKQELHPRTAVINKTQKNKSKKARSDALIWLAANFPNAFDNSLRIRPFKAGIMADILQHADKAAEAGISKSKLREAVVIFTRRLDYLACLKAREMRIDLQGNNFSEVTEKESIHAGAKIKKRVEKSVRNARKIAAEAYPHPSAAPQQNTNYHSKYYTHSHSHSQNQGQGQSQGHSISDSENYLPTYPPRAEAFNSSTQPAKTSTVVVKHKTTRQFDPSAVARLKEKLGLSRKSMEQKEEIT